jgi:putative inorganic carbon (hco3(-)) transporter
MQSTHSSPSMSAGVGATALALLCSAVVGWAIVRSGDARYALILPALVAFAMVVRSVLFAPLLVYIFVLFFDDTMMFFNFGSAPKWLGALAAVTVGVRLLRDRTRLTPPPVARWLLLLVFWSLLTILWSINTYASQEGFITLGGVVLTTIVIGMSPLSEREQSLIRDAVIATGVVVAILALQSSSGRWLEMGQVTTRLGVDLADQVAANPNGLALCLLLPIALALGGMLTPGRVIRQAVSFVAFVAMVIALVLTQSRGGLIGLGALVASVAVGLRIARARLVVVALVLFAVLWQAAPIISARFEGADFESGAGRREIWDAGLHALTDHWLFGSGIGTFPYAYRAVVLVRGGGTTGWNARDAHNIYLNVGVELGILGFLLFCGALWASYRDLSNVKKLRPIEPLFVKAALAGLFVGTFFSNAIRAKWYWLTITLAMIAARSAVAQDEPEREYAEGRSAIHESGHRSVRA